MFNIDNNICTASSAIQMFFESDKQCMLVNGTNSFSKHKIIIAVLNTICKNEHFLFRTNSLNNIAMDDFMGWVGVKKTPKSGEQIKIGNNYYEFDSLFDSGTKSRTSNSFDCALVYPAESILLNQKYYYLLDELFQGKKICRTFLITNIDTYSYDYSVLRKYADCELTLNR